MEEARAKFRTKINATINEGKSCKLDTNRDAKEIRRKCQSTYMDMERRLDYLLG